MIIETTELATAYKGLSSVIIEARSYVETLNHLLKIRKVFGNMLKKAEGYKASVSEIIKLIPQNMRKFKIVWKRHYISTHIQKALMKQLKELWLWKLR
uniref:DHC_N1 domain-containing protein n=1 Tax=Heterorhabditis bacteriophora TaxID=37862 RepID=A0A1I7WIG2_HETBA